MDLINGDIRAIYRKYLISSLTGAVVLSVYSFVDTIAVGQSEGAAGAASMAVINPLFGIIVFFAILCAVGGSVLFSNRMGQGKTEEARGYFTAAVLLMTAVTAVLWSVFLLFPRPILTLFGADHSIYDKMMEYAWRIILAMPLFIAPIFLASFLRNDGAPHLAMTAVIVGGCVNMLGDWLLVFPLGMGMRGAALATVAGTTVQLLVMLRHFARKGCGLRFVRPKRIWAAFGEILQVGFGAGVLDLGTVVLSVIMNNQILRYGNTDCLAVYGVAATILALLQALFCGVGQAIQPIVSVNFGANRPARVARTWRMALVTVLILGVLFTAVGLLFPREITALFVDATEEILLAAPGIIRPFFLVYLFMGITVLATYHLQSTMQSGRSMLVALLRSVIVSGILLLVLPLFLDLLGVWLALPLAELLVAVPALRFVRRSKPLH